MTKKKSGGAKMVGKTLVINPTKAILQQRTAEAKARNSRKNKGKK